MPFKAGEVAGIEDSGGMLAEGRYVVTVTRAYEDDVNNVPVWHLEMQTTTGQSVKDRLFWSPKAMIRGKLACQAFGVDLESDPEAVISAEMLAGRSCEVEIEHHEGEGRDGKQRMFSGVPFRGYHALTAAQANAQAQASTQAKAAVRPLFGGAAAPAAPAAG